MIHFNEKDDFINMLQAINSLIIPEAAVFGVSSSSPSAISSIFQSVGIVIVDTSFINFPELKPVKLGVGRRCFVYFPHFFGKCGLNSMSFRSVRHRYNQEI
jgi:hypothetical protein